MALVRSILFALVLLVLTPPFALIALATFPLKAHQRYHIISYWARIVLWFTHHLLGIRYTVLGRENMPEQSAVVLCKHQSAWETIAVQQILPPICFVLKRELLWIPFFGWGLAQMPTIAINRKAGKDALSQVVQQGRKRLGEGFWVLVFPEGTRVSPGTQRRYKPGGALLAVKAKAPVVPVAHNAGEFWKRNAFIKRPGEIIFSIGPVILTEGRSASQVNAEAEAWIEGEMRRLFPHHYPNGEAVHVPD